MARCEDFPACGHYDPRTGETYCREANLSPEEREIEEAEKRHEDELRAIRKRHERQRDLDSRPTDCLTAFQAAPDTYVEHSNLSTLGDVKQALDALWAERGEDAPFPTVKELEERLGRALTADDILGCHEDDEEHGYKACAPCTSEWEADAENARRDEEYVFGPPDEPEYY